MDYARRIVEGEECEDDLMEEGDGIDEVDTSKEEVKKSVSEFHSSLSVNRDLLRFYKLGYGSSYFFFFLLLLAVQIITICKTLLILFIAMARVSGRMKYIDFSA